VTSLVVTPVLRPAAAEVKAPARAGSGARQNGPVADLSPGEQFAGCRIEAVAGRGGMGVVYRATELGLGRPVALKLLAGAHAADPDFRERFQRESRMAAAIDHPNVIPVYTAGEEDGRLYLVMRYVAGTDLHALLRRERSLAPDRAAGIVAQIAAALDAAHAAGLVHRDVKPGNVLLAGDHAYLSDFGLTRHVGADTELTATGQWIGTVDYCSPEQLQGERTDARSDVYALGCVLFAALTGQTPLGRGTVPSTMMAHLHDEPPRISAFGAPREFDRVIWRALAKDPEERYPSAGDLGRAAQAAARGEPVTESERSVARGPAAPATVAPTGNGHTAATVAAPAPGAADPADPADIPDAPDPADPPTEALTAHTRVAPAERAQEPRPGVRVHRRSRGRVAAAGLVAVAALIAVGLLLSVILGGPGATAERSGPLGRNEVRAAAEAFATAYGHEDALALRRIVTRDVRRVLPSGVARGRDAVVRQYESQFDGRVRSYDLTGLDVTGGAAGRASGDYRVEREGGPPIEGRIVFGVVRDRGEARIALIAATPKS
jgi:serine/threonine protein kinase